MKNELQESWDKHKEKHSLITYLDRDRMNFQAGFNAAFKLFRQAEPNKPNKPDREKACGFCGLPKYMCSHI